jgi:response regulator NasT
LTNAHRIADKQGTKRLLSEVRASGPCFANPVYPQDMKRLHGRGWQGIGSDQLRILLVDENPERSDVVLAGLKEAGHDVIATIKKADDLRQAIKAHKPDLVIIELDSPYRDYLEDLITINRENPRPIAMFVGQDDPTIITEAIETGVSVYVAEGLSSKLVRSILQVAMSQFAKFRKLQEELEKSKSALAERKTVERAKGLLMAHKDMTEEEAYRFLRKMAMDQNRRLGEVAESVLALAQLFKS